MTHYLEITEIRNRARQGRTEPFMCSAADGKNYFYQTKMLHALTVWSSALGSLPKEWCEQNEELGLFDPETTFQHLWDDANGAIWTRLMQ